MAPQYTIGRPVDPRYPTNRAIMFVAAGVFVMGAAYQLIEGGSFGPSLRWGAIVAGALFLAWALGRELDPDNPYSAFVASALAVTAAVVYGLPGLMFSLWALLFLRIVNRTCGPPATPVDSIITMGLALLAVSQGFWLAGLAMAVAFAADAMLAPTNRRQWMFAAASFIGTAIINGLPDLEIATAPVAATWAVLGIAIVLMLLAITTSRRIKSVGDQTGQPLSSQRVRMAQTLALAVGTWMVAIYGQAGLVASSPVWAAMLGAGLYRLRVQIANGVATQST